MSSAQVKQNKWQELNEKTNELSLRERAILAGTGVVIVIFAWLQFYFTPYEKQVKSYTSQKNSLLQEKVNQSTRLGELTKVLDNDPNKALRSEQSRLKEELENVKSDIEGRMSHLIAPEKMADVLQSVLSDYKGLKLISARNLEVEPLALPGSPSRNSQITSTVIQSTSGADVSSSAPVSEQAAIFAHGFEMTLSGTYFQTVEFLQRLETMHGFYWRSLDYRVDKYPKAEITIQISTLSLEEDWIGV